MKQKRKFRSRAPAVRNASSAVRAPRTRTNHDAPLRRLGYTAAGAAGTALVGSFLAREGWAPRTIATALAAVGAGLAWKGDQDSVRDLGAGAMSAAGSQLALMLIDDVDKPATNGTVGATGTASVTAPKTSSPLPRPANAGELPAGALQNAFERAKARLALTTSAPAQIEANT